VLFDEDGTLVDTNYVHALCWWQAFSQYGYVVPMARLHRAVGMGADLLVEHVLDRQDRDASDIITAMLDTLARPDVDVVVSGDDVKEAKPHPDLLSTALERAGLRPQDAVLVGDSVWDVEAAARAGLECIGLTCGGTSADELTAAGAVQTFDDPSRLLDHWRGVEADG
jgi:beta-phosphoglucomutase-like phosphatase (HAD superfamily)